MSRVFQNIGKLLWHALGAKMIELVPGECASANAS